MAQYCRYCAFCYEGDCFYCSRFERVLSDGSIKRANHCQEFALSDLGDVETGKQYQPRKPKRKNENEHQIRMEV